MATPRFTQLEVWDKLACQGGARLAVVPSLAALEDVRRLTGEERLTVKAASLGPGVSALAERRVLRAAFTDGSFDEWILTELDEVRKTDGGLETTAVGLWPTVLLSQTEPVNYVGPDGSRIYAFDALGLTISQHLSAYILPALGTWWSGFAAGTIDSSAPFDLTYDHTSPLAACLQLAKAAGLEFQLRRNGSTDYKLDFVAAIGSSASTLRLRTGHNVRSVRRGRDTSEQATYVFPRGAPGETGAASIGLALWKVTSTPSTTRAVLADPLGGAGPLGWDDQLNGRALRKWPSGAWVAVNDCTAGATQELTTGTAHGLSTGDLVQFAADTAGAELTYLKHPLASLAPPSGYGMVAAPFDRPDIPATVNWLTNPANRLGYTVGFSAVNAGGTSPTLSDETTAGRWRIGGKSIKVLTTGDGQGLQTDWAAIAPTDAQPAFSGFWAYWNDTVGGVVRVELVLGASSTASVSSMTRAGSSAPYTVTVTTSGAHGFAAGDAVEISGAAQAAYNNIWTVRAVLSSTQFTFELNSTPTTPATGTITARKVWQFPDPVQRPGLGLATKRWVELGIRNVNGKALSAGVAKLRILQHGSTSLTLYVDGVQLTRSGEQQAFVEGSGPVQLWQAANNYLATHAYPLVDYEPEAADLARLGLGDNDAILGQPVALVDLEAGFAPTTRLVERRRDLLRAAVTGLRVSSRPEDMTDMLARLPRPPRQPTDPGDTPRLGVSASFATDPSQVSTLFCRLSSSPIGAAIYYWIGDAGQPPPQIGQVQAGGPSATLWGTYAGSFSVNVGQSADLVLYAYAVLGADLTDQVASWKLENRLTAALSANLQQISASAVRASWTPNNTTRRVRVYARRVASPGSTSWPTSDGTQSAEISETYFLQELDVNVTGGGFDKNGSTVAGGTTITIDQSTVVASASGAWANGDKCAVILVPRDHNGNPGTRSELSLTFATTAPASIASFTATRTSDGTACADGSGAGFTLTWSEGSTAWSDATHDLKLYVSEGGQPETLITTITSPHTTTGYSWQGYYKKTGGKFDPTVLYQFRAELWDNSPAQLDSRAASPISFASTCAL